MSVRYFQRCNQCGKNAFEWLKKPKCGDRINATNVIFEDGTQPKALDRILCQHCKKGVLLDSRNLVEVRQCLTEIENTAIMKLDPAKYYAVKFFAIHSTLSYPKITMFQGHSIQSVIDSFFSSIDEGFVTILPVP